ncbi:hypothetical protein OG618_00725 [Kitasatospora sp. NBC_01246]|uniref:hypothetical protein n=1 Tax=Kitasatospora sp. NBC_01246 TaxID=2903570 RepID=UPI002E36D715|nr:hypothetical protein [Kitasatospora sp. NBC_01246]
MGARQLDVDQVSLPHTPVIALQPAPSTLVVDLGAVTFTDMAQDRLRRGGGEPHHLRPDRDLTVRRWRREQAYRARAAQATTAPDTRRKIVLTALRRAGLEPTEAEADHQTARRLAHLDHHTMTAIAGWVEAAFAAALRRTAPVPPTRPVVRRAPIRPDGHQAPE